MFGITSFSSRPFSTYEIPQFGQIVYVGSVYSTAYVNSVSVYGGASVVPVGVYAIGRIGSPVMWGLINDNQNPNWNVIPT